jgi:hypothetical protein
MIVMIIYVLLVAVGQVVAFFVGQIVDSMIPPAWSLIVAMVLFFSVIAAMWPVAVWITEKWFVKPEAAR